MAFYVPASARRRKLIAAAAAAAVIGIAIGVFVGRLMVPSIEERVHSVQQQARATSAGLRVLALHDTATTVGSQGADAGGVNIVLQRTREELQREFRKAPWLTAQQRELLIGKLDALVAINDKAGSEFGQAAEKLAAAIDAVFSG